MATAELFLDESGYTGPDLINAEQPAFTLASTNIGETEARSLLESCFGDRQGEIKCSRLIKSERGQRQMVDFVRALDLNRGNCAFYSFHKQFLLLAFLIDFWLEPMMHEDGVNLYERGGNIALNNISYLTLGTCLGLDGRRELLRQFQVMTRDRTRFAFDSFWDHLETVVHEHALIDRALGALPVARHRLGYEHLVRLPAGLLDLGDYGLLETVQHWREKLPDSDFVVVHDHSKLLAQQRTFWEAVLNQANPAGTVGQDRRTITFPLPVKGLRLEDSRHFPQLQVADLIASAARADASRIVNRSDDPFCDALRDAGLRKALAGGVWPTTAVHPDDLETNGPVLGDAAEFISGLVRRAALRESKLARGFVAQPAGQSVFSLVLAVVIPSSIETKIFDDFPHLLDSWPHKEAEIKGSKLDESQAAQLIDLVSGYDAFVKFFAVDMATHGDKVVGDFKARQAAGVTANLTPEHHPPIVAQMEELAAAIRRMPNQLFVQAFLMIELVLKVIEESTLYYVQRLPAELGSIAWIIDRKNRTITEMESTWSTLVLPMSESHFARKPLVCLAEADYSHFDARYGIAADDVEMNRHAQWMREAYGIRDRQSRSGLERRLAPQRAERVCRLGQFARATTRRHARDDFAAWA